MDRDPASFSNSICGDESEVSATVLSYINQMLMEEEDTEEKSRMFHDSLALQAAEKSFYEVIGDHQFQYSSSSSSVQIEDQDSNLSDSSGGSTCNSTESRWSGIAPTRHNPFVPPNLVFHSNSTNHAGNGNFTTTNSGFLGTAMAGFNRGAEQGSNFLPRQNATIFASPRKPRQMQMQMVYKTESKDTEHLNGGSIGRKNHVRDDDEAELQDDRSTKQSAVNTDGSELSELFDNLLLGTGMGKGDQNEASSSKKHGKTEQVVDLRKLLMQCAQAVSCDNPSIGEQLLKQIKEHSTPTGDGSQRLGHYFGNALEARLGGRGSEICSVLASKTKRASAVDMIKAYQMYASACPFDKLAIIFTNNSIWNVAKEAETLHIIDFGILHGFKWPALIHRLSKRPGGPPELRITGIEFPQPGFRPEERLHETGRLLAKYCRRFNVPFEFNGIARKWEAIKIEDLKIKKNEIVAVNSKFRFENLLDETVVPDNPRGAVLSLIKKVNPNIFVHSIVNGSYDAPFFLTRFREALFHYSALFDMLDANVASEDPMRLTYEREFFGRQVMNVIACEGCHRVERPETYKQWQVRNTRIGFRQLPLDHQIVIKLKARLRDDSYHSDFMLQVHGNWVLQGWKGRILHASSCWLLP